MAGELILAVRNRHVAEFVNGPEMIVGGIGSGPFPLEVLAKGVVPFVSYFQGSQGDQWLCFEGHDGDLFLTGGDVDWRTFPVVALDTNMPAQGCKIDGLVLSVPEAEWIDACWRAWLRKERPGRQDAGHDVPDDIDPEYEAFMADDPGQHRERGLV